MPPPAAGRMLATGVSAEIDEFLPRDARRVVLADEVPLLVVDEVGRAAGTALAHALAHAVDRVAVAVARPA